MFQRFVPRGALLGAFFLSGASMLGGLVVASAARAFATSEAIASEKTEKETVAEARALLTAKDPQGAADLIAKYLSTAICGYELEDVYGQALLQLGRKDEAAQHFGIALRLLGDNEAPKKAITANLTRADSLYTRRTSLMLRISKDLLKDCEKMLAAGHTDRALAILEPLEAISTGVEKQTIVALVTKIRAATQEVKLDQGNGDEAESGAHALVHLEGKHYILEANLERDIVQRVSDVMDDIFNYYVLVYFDKDETRVNPQKPTIRIHPTHDEMMKEWQGPPNPGIGGWWSPGEWQVTCYDTRSNSGSTDQMLQTLYHEASHHFMTMLAKGGSPPAWINEGTATFFEGAKAMADRRVLWPDAAIDRLRALHYQLTGGPGPTPAQVIAFDQPGSYAGEYYSFGWGLVYYLLEYEDPTTLEKVFRPLYSEYRETIAKRGGDPMELFKQVFLGPKAPGGFATIEPWAAKWREWILNEVYPLHNGLRMRDLRLEKAKLYIEAAARSKTDKSAKVGEAELLARALGHLEYIRTKIDGDQKLDVDLILMQADVLEGMGRPQGTAALLEQVLDLADAGETTLEPERYEELEKRLTKLDVKNQALRQAKIHCKNYAKQVLKLIDDYQLGEAPKCLTPYEFGRLLSSVLENDPLSKATEELRAKARDAGLLHGALYKIGGRASAWVSLFERPDETFEPSDATIALANARPVGRLFTGVPLTGEYELRCTLNRVGDLSLTTFQGVVFSGNPTTPWYTAGIDGKGKLVLRRYEKTGSERALKIIKLDVPVAKDESPTFAVHVYQDSRVIIRIGERAPIEIGLEEALPKTAYVGIFSKNGRTELTSTVLEVFP